MLNKTLLFFVSLFTTLVVFTAGAHAANAIDPADGSLDVAKAVYDALHGGHYAYAAAMALVVAVALLRKYGGSAIPALHTDAGSALLVLGGSFGAALAATLAGGGPLTWPLAWSAACVAFAAAGGYATIKKLVVTPLLPKLPPWLAGVVGFLFVHASDPGNTPPAGDVRSA